MADERELWRAQVGDPAVHARIVDGLPLLHDVVVHEPPTDHEPLTGWLRVAAWNLERGRHSEAMAERLRRTGAQLVLLSEADVGMARSSNVDVPQALARALHLGSAFAIEFVELGLGDASEAAAVEAAGGGRNAHGLHGNAILCAAPLLSPRAVRIELRGEWFSSDRGEPRVGGRVAVLATIELDAVPVSVVSLHLESASDGADRAEQLATVLDAIPDGPAIVGGDCNTFGAAFAELADRATLRNQREADPTRFAWPVAYEPLFDVARRHGFEWLDANVAAPTTHHRPDGAPHHHPLKIDWLFTRGLEARRPTVVAAQGPDGMTLSDHELIAVSVRLLR